MARRDATTPSEADMLTEELLGAVPAKKEPEPEPEPEPADSRTPHERNRINRQMSFTLPSVEWKRVIKDQADDWDMRPSDFLLYCVSYTMANIKDGVVGPPDGEIGRFYHRAGEAFDLPWTPS